MELKSGDVLVFRIPEDIDTIKRITLRRQLQDVIEQIPVDVVGIMLPYGVEMCAVASKAVKKWEDKNQRKRDLLKYAADK